MYTDEPSTAGGPKDRITFFGFLATVEDAMLVVEATNAGLCQRVKRRLQAKEMGCIRSGAVFVFDENEANMKRWTDKLLWSPSRQVGSFFVYRQMSTKIPRGTSVKEIAAISLAARGGVAPPVDPEMQAAEKPYVGSLTSGPQYAREGLVKKTLAIGSIHIVSYFSLDDVQSGRLQTPSQMPIFASLRISPRLTGMINMIQTSGPSSQGDSDEDYRAGSSPSDAYFHHGQDVRSAWTPAGYAHDHRERSQSITSPPSAFDHRLSVSYAPFDIPQQPGPSQYQAQHHALRLQPLPQHPSVVHRRASAHELSHETLLNEPITPQRRDSIQTWQPSIPHLPSSAAHLHPPGPLHQFRLWHESMPYDHTQAYPHNGHFYDTTHFYNGGRPVHQSELPFPSSAPPATSIHDRVGHHARHSPYMQATGAVSVPPISPITPINPDVSAEPWPSHECGQATQELAKPVQTPYHPIPEIVTAQDYSHPMQIHAQPYSEHDMSHYMA